jgi:nitrogen regulatory protein PII
MGISIRTVKQETGHYVVEAIATSAHTDKISDGKIFIMPLENVICIRTGECGNDSI